MKSFHLENTLRSIKDKKTQLFVFFFCGFSHLLLYSYLQENILSIFEWQDYAFHLRIIQILEEQNTYIPYFGNDPIPYPVLFHNVVRMFSDVLDVEPESALLLVSSLFSFGFCVLAFLVISEVLSDSLAGFVCVILLGAGASSIVFFSKTISFGGAFIFPIGYLVAGYLPNLMGHFFGLFILYVILKTKLQKWYYLALCTFLCMLLVLSHLIASVTYLAALTSVFVCGYFAGESIRFKHFGIILLLSVVVTCPWWLGIIEEVQRRPYLFFLSDAGQSWIDSGLSTEIIEYYGFIPFASILGLLYLYRVSKTGNFITLWLFMLFPLLFTRWGFRFALELAVPLYMLGSIGISRIFELATLKKMRFWSIRFIILFFVFFILFNSLRLFDLARTALVETFL